MIETTTPAATTDTKPHYTFALIDEAAKKEVRRACLKAIAIPGYQVPFASRELPIARGFGTGALQITLSIIGPSDLLKVIDQGADESVNACNIRALIRDVCPGVQTTTQTPEASIVQTRHRIPETPMTEAQVLVLQVPYPDPLEAIEPSETARVVMHGEADYARLYVKLYEDIVHHHEITIGYRYPTRVGDHYVIDPSPIPRWDVPKLHRAPCLRLFGAGREKKIYAVPPYTDTAPLEFEDVRFAVERFTDGQGQRQRCARCGRDDTFLEQTPQPDGTSVFTCSDTEYCRQPREPA